MGKKVRKTLSNEEKYSMLANEKANNLDSTCDTDIIECSIVDGNLHGSLKKVKHSFKRLNDTLSLNTPLHKKEPQWVFNSTKSSNKALGLSLRKCYRVSDDKISAETSMLKTPCTVKNGKESNSAVKKMISTLKKTPDGPYLSVSKLRNIEQWLNENDVETVRTPPFANLSVTPINSVKKRLSSRWKDENVEPEESPIDSDVEGVLKAVYGEDWQRKNSKARAKTEPRKRSKGFFSPLSQTTKKGAGVVHSVRRNILNDKAFNLGEKSDAENNLDNSFVSGIRMINLDSSSCNEEYIKKNTVKSFQSRRKDEAEESDFESLDISPVKSRKKQRGVPSETLEKKKEASESSTCKTLPTNATLKTPKKTFLASLSVSTPTSRCHPDAQYYKLNFRSKKEELVRKLFKLYNGEIFDWKLAEDMNFSWNVKLRGTAGYCYNKRVTKSTGEVIRQSRVEFSTKIVDRADRLRDTMIHELCHAASWVIDGVLDGHGEVWTKWASRASGRFPELPAIKRCHNYDIVSKYVYRCTGCGYSIKRHSKSINTERKRCGHCYGVLELLINKKRKGKGEVPEFDTTRTLPTPNKFAMFVKENYHSVKSTKTNAKHSEIMKVLSEKYAFLKNGSKSTKKSHE